MARPRRPGQGYRYSSGGGGLDLGAILMSAFGGVEANPDFGQSVPRPDENFTGPMPPTKTSGDFYRPKTFMDRSEASRLNADYKLAQLEANSDMQRQLALERELSPIRVNEANQIGSADHQRKLELEKSKVINELLKAAGAMPTESNQVAYDKTVSPAGIEAMLQAFKEKAATSQAAQAKSNFEREKILGTSESLIGQAIAESQFGRNLAEATLKDPNLIQDTVQTQRGLMLLKPRSIISEMLKDRFSPVSPGQSLVDKQTGNVIYDKPALPQAVDPEKEAQAAILRQALGKLGGVNAPPTNVVSPPISTPAPRVVPLTPEEIYIDPETGKHYKKSR